MPRTAPESSAPLAGGADLDPAQLAAGGSLPARWAARWAAAPSAPVLGAAAENGTWRWWKGSELDQLTRRAAGVLRRAGLGPGGRMVWSTAPSLPSVVACLGALRLGAVVVPANPDYTERELGHIVADVRPAVAVVGRPEQAGWVSARAPAATVLGPDLSAEGARATAPADDGEGPPLDQAGPDDPALIVYTSGTTGSPKGAVLTHGNLLAGTKSLQVAWRWSPEDRLVLALPLFHVHGLCVGLFGTLDSGGSAVLLERFDPDGVLGSARAHGATLFFGVPTMYRRLLASPDCGALGRLRLCVSGSAPLPAALWHEIRDCTGVAVLERYGMTETLLTVSNPLDGERRPGTVGFPLPGVATRLAEEGAELWVRGPTVFRGYWERPAETAESFDADGWFGTGDLFGHDEAGYLVVRGRARDLIISGGYNVYPAEVEDVLGAHPGVGEVAVAGTPSPEWGETVTAWVVADGPLDPDDLLAFAAERLAPYKRPRLVRLVDSLPRNAMGKVQRKELR